MTFFGSFLSRDFLFRLKRNLQVTSQWELGWFWLNLPKLINHFSKSNLFLYVKHLIICSLLWRLVDLLLCFLPAFFLQIMVTLFFFLQSWSYGVFKNIKMHSYRENWIYCNPWQFLSAQFDTELHSSNVIVFQIAQIKSNHSLTIIKYTINKMISKELLMVCLFKSKVYLAFLSSWFFILINKKISWLLLFDVFAGLCVYVCGERDLFVDGHLAWWPVIRRGIWKKWLERLWNSWVCLFYR